MWNVKNPSKFNIDKYTQSVVLYKQIKLEQTLPLANKSSSNLWWKPMNLGWFGVLPEIKEAYITNTAH